MRKIILFTAISIFFSLVVNAQPEGRLAEIDSLQKSLTGLSLDSNRVKTLQKIGRICIDIGRFNLAESVLRKSIDLADSIGYIDGYYLSRGQLAVVLQMTGRIEEGIEHQRAKLAYFIEVGDSSGMALELSNLSTSYYNLGNLDSAFAVATRGLEIAEKADDGLLIGGLYHTIGSIKFLEGEEEDGLTYIEKALEFAREHNDKFLEAMCLNGLASHYANHHEFDKAFPLAEKSYEIQKELGSVAGQVLSLLTLSHFHFENKNYEQGLEFGEIGLGLAQNIDFVSVIPELMISLGMNTMELGQFSASENWLTKARKRASELNMLRAEERAVSELSELYEGNGKYEKAMAMARVNLELRDSIYNEEKIASQKKMEVRFKVKEKDRDIALLEKDHELQEANLQASQQQSLLFGIVALAFLFIAGLIGFFLRKIRRSEKELQTINQTKDRFFGIIAHDLRGSSTTFQGLGAVLQDCLENNRMDDLQSVLVQMDKDAEGLNHLLDNLLNWAFSQLKRVPYNPRIVQVDEIAEGVIATFEDLARAKNIHLRSEIPSNSYAFADPDAIELVFRNLVQNAIKFTRSGGEIKLQARAIKDKLEVSVSDNGIGMEAEEIERLFSIGPKGQKGTQGEFGSGLGLVLCREFLEINHGKIYARSIKNVGSEFSFLLPRAA